MTPLAHSQAIRDEAHLLTITEAKALAHVVEEHLRLSEEQIVIAILKTQPGSSGKSAATQLFRDWKLGDKNKDNAVLIAIFKEEKEDAWVIPGFGLDEELSSTDADLMSLHLRTALGEHQSLGKALGGTLFQVLTALHSPLIDSGLAQQIFVSNGLWDPRSGATGTGGGQSERVLHYGLWAVILFVFGSAALFLALDSITSAEICYSSEGAFRLKPWFKRILFIKRIRKLQTKASVSAYARW